MKSNLRLIILIGLFPVLLFGQKSDYLAEMYAAYNGVSQKKGTEELLKDYLGVYKNCGEEIFAILFAPQACPRCEVDINYLLDNVARIKPDATIVLIVSYPDVAEAKKYVRRFHTKNVIFDTENKHDQIFYYRAGRLGVTYFLQIDTKQGRLKCGGDSPTMNDGFLRQFCNNTNYQPFYDSQASEKDTDSDLILKFERVPLRTYSQIVMNNAKDEAVSAVLEMPEWYENLFLYSDELLSKGMLYKIQNDTAYLEKEIFPTLEQETTFVSLEDSVYQDLKNKGMVYIMSNGCAFIPDSDEAVVSYSLPRMFVEGEDDIAYYNHNAFISSKEETGLFSFDFEMDSIPLYMYTHAARFVPLNNRYFLIGCKRGYPTSISLDSLMRCNSVFDNIFLPEFYDDSPFVAVFDRETNKLVRRMGKLDDVFKKSSTGYYLAGLVGDAYGEKLIYGDGYSGKLWFTDKYSNEKNSKVDEIVLFDVKLTDLPRKQSLRYKDEYFESFFEDFHQNIETVKLDSKGIHCWIRKGKSAVRNEGDVYEYRMLTYSGQLKNSFYLKLEDGDDFLSVGLGRHRDGGVFPFYFCKNEAKAYLKYNLNL